MTPLNLILGLQKRFESELATYTMESERQSKKIGVHLSLANENFTNEDLYPLVLINLLYVEDLALESTRTEMSVATVDFTVGIYGEDREAIFDLLNVCEFIRQSLIRDSIIDSRHRLKYPIQTRILPEQPYPFQFGHITTQFTVGRKF